MPEEAPVTRAVRASWFTIRRSRSGSPPGARFEVHGHGSFDATQDKALQVIGFWNADQHRMIAALHPLLHDRKGRMAVDGRVVKDLREQRLVDVVRATAG